MRSLGAQFWPGLRDAYPVQRRFRGGEGTVFAVRTCDDVMKDFNATLAQLQTLSNERMAKCLLTGGALPSEVFGNDPEVPTGEGGESGSGASEGGGGSSDCESLDQQINALFQKLEELMIEADTCARPDPETAPA